MKKELRILSIGNSFSVDTMTHLANVALDLGYESVHLGNLFIGGCPIARHYENIMADGPNYVYYTNVGKGWRKLPGYRISDAILDGPWDWISIQHGTGRGDSYIDPTRYEKLPALIAYVKKLAAPGTKIAFNMTWVGDPDCGKGGMQFFPGDQLGLYRKITQTTQEQVLTQPDIERVSPTGTAIQNARAAGAGSLTRDGYHLSRDLGRYIASMTFYRALTGNSIDEIQWMPEGVTEDQRALAIQAVNRAIETPFDVTV